MREQKNLIDLPKDDHGCWQWLGTLTESGHGLKYADSKKRVLAHVWTFRLFSGKIPNRMELRNTCGNRSCVKPGHWKVVPKRHPADCRILTADELQALRENYPQGVDAVYQACESLKDIKREHIERTARTLGVKFSIETKHLLTCDIRQESLKRRGYNVIEKGGDDERMILENYPKMGMKVHGLPGLEKYTRHQIKNLVTRLGVKIQRTAKHKAAEKNILTFEQREDRKKQVNADPMQAWLSTGFV